MDFDEIVVKESPGLCRCCLSEGCYKDLGSEYSWMSETEIYADMLLECFDISISQHPTGPNGSNRLICEVCITRLRDACNFKKQVLESEKKFVDMVGRGEFRPKVLLYQTQMKTERVMELEEETGADDSGEVEYLEEDADFVDEELLKNEDYGEASVSEDITVSTLAVKGKRGRPKKAAAKPEKKAKVAKTEEKPKKAVAKDPKKHDLRVPTQIEWQKAAARRYVHSVLTHSSLLPFRWRGNRYICFYCHYTFTEASCLRTHTRTHQNLAIMKHLTQTRDFAPIKVDIGETLKCLKCKHEDDSLEGLINHLKTHKLIGDIEQECFLPFKLADNQISCMKCAKSYQSFGMLYSHMNKVHLEGTKRICEACGESFFSDFSLRKHVQSHHSNSDFKCSHCNEKFKLDANRISHEYKEHNIKSFKCYKCDEMFGSHYLRRLHLHSTHMKMEFTCKECSKTFLSKSLLNRHVNRVHLKEKNFTCPVCGEKFFDLGTLNVHAKKHSYSQQKSFQCKVCLLVFGGKVELSDHMVTHAGQSLSLK
ncbi:zinc finger protein 26-like isoform X10 [Cydia splendana]|uniref:zinc finger protein 26-like isoform X10 n=1 Tax=Cydia splendana TaxID=1100963 RepID=UPI00300C5772